MELDPPYVYNVHQGDEKAFIKAVQDAISHPIDRYVLLPYILPSHISTYKIMM